MIEVTQEYLKSFIHYDPDTGIFTRIAFPPSDKTKKRPDLIGVPTGSVGKNGYVDLRLGVRRMTGHRAAFLWMTGSIPVVVDHKDGNRSNNRWDNLRACDQSHNLANMGPTKRSTSGIKGVYPCKPGTRWRAQIRVYYQTIHLGCYGTKEEAAEAYKAAAIEYFGEFARV